MQQFSAAYLRESRRGLWAGDREALAPLSLADRERILDVGAGTGAFTRLLAEDSDADLVAVDADRELLSEVQDGSSVGGDATRLPLQSDVVDLAVCQALLVNLPDPVVAVRELARVSSDLVAAVEPDNAAVSVDSTVSVEIELAERARAAYIDGHDPDATLGAETEEIFREAGLKDVHTNRHVRERTVEPPYTDYHLREAIRKIRATRIEANRETFLAGELTETEFEQLRSDWRAMGRTVADQMDGGSYRRTESLPLYVTVGRIENAFPADES